MFVLCYEFDGYTLPPSVVERYASADAAALKTAFFLLQYGKADEATLCERLRLAPETAARSLSFWASAGLVREGDAPKKPHMTSSELARRTLENEELKVLFREAQRLVGDTLSHAETVSLAELYEYDGINLETLLTCVAYSVERAERGRLFSYIKRSAAEWKRAGIDTIDKAEAHILKMNAARKREQAVAAALSVSPDSFKLKDRRLISKWFEEYGYDEKFAAEAVLRSGKTDIPYLDAIIKSWHEKGFETVKETRAAGGNAPVPTSKKNKGSFFDDALNREREDDR